MLAIVEYIKKYGLDAVSTNLKLKVKTYENKLHLKYDQLESDMSLKEVQECRGLILDRHTLEVISMSFFKFFNEGETNAAKIDWDTASVFEKVDGSMMQVYWDPYANKWFAGTTGTAEGEGEVNNKFGTTFNDLFWQVVNDKSPNMLKWLNKLKHCTFVFELTTPYNIVVKPHGESSITLLAARDNKTLKELRYIDLKVLATTFGVPLVKIFDLNAKNFGDLIKTFEGMPWSEEGYVVVDANFNRAKIKNPAYCAVHHLKGKTAEHNILTIVKTNEIEEFAATFPERREELFRLKTNYDLLNQTLTSAWEELTPRRPKNITANERKLFAAAVFEVCNKYKITNFSGLFFSLEGGKVNSVNDYLMEYDDKKLYKML